MKTLHSLKHWKLLLGIGSAFCIFFNSNLYAALPTVLDTEINPANSHIYYLLTSSTWTNAESEAVNLGGTLTTINDAAEDAWVLNTFSTYGGVDHELLIGLYDPSQDTNGQPHANNFVWADGEPLTYTNWRPGEPNGVNATPFYVYMYGHAPAVNTFAGEWNDYDGNSSIVAEPSVYGVVEVVPEPSSVVLLACGVIAMLGGIWAHKRRESIGNKNR